MKQKITLVGIIEGVISGLIVAILIGILNFIFTKNIAITPNARKDKTEVHNRNLESQTVYESVPLLKSRITPYDKYDKVKVRNTKTILSIFIMPILDVIVPAGIIFYLFCLSFLMPFIPLSTNADKVEKQITKYCIIFLSLLILLVIIFTLTGHGQIAVTVIYWYYKVLATLIAGSIIAIIIMVLGRYKLDDHGYLYSKYKKNQKIERNIISVSIVISVVMVIILNPLNL